MNPVRKRLLVRALLLLSQCFFFDESIETGFFSRRRIFLDNIFFRGLVEAFYSESKLFLCRVDIVCFYGFARFLDGAFGNPFHSLISHGLSRGNAHVFLGGILDGHSESS